MVTTGVAEASASMVNNPNGSVHWIEIHATFTDQTPGLNLIKMSPSQHAHFDTQNLTRPTGSSAAPRPNSRVT